MFYNIIKYIVIVHTAYSIGSHYTCLKSEVDLFWTIKVPHINPSILNRPVFGQPHRGPRAVDLGGTGQV